MVAANDKITERVPTFLDGLYEIYRRIVLPIEKAFHYDSFHSPFLSESEIKAKPMVLLLGQYSTGKTTFVRALLGRDYPGARVGPEPTTDKFFAVSFGQEKTIPGSAATLGCERPYSGLKQFGEEFLAKFQLSEVPASILDSSCTIIDTPGVLAGDKQRYQRSYDFVQVCRWFAERADMILLFFDSHKLDISDEFKEVLNALEPFDERIRIILNKSDQVRRTELMRIYGALMWSLGKIISGIEVPRVYITHFAEADGVALEGTLDREELMKDIKMLPLCSANHRINLLVKRIRQVKIHSILVDHLRKQLPTFFGKGSKQKKLMLNLPAEFDQVHICHQIPVSDFPEIERFAGFLGERDLSAFPKLSTRQLQALDEAITTNIPNLMRKFMIRFGSSETLLGKNPFYTAHDRAFDADLDVWQWSEVDFASYASIFESFNPVSGRLSGAQCRDLFSTSGIETGRLSQMWNLVDRDRKGSLDANEFAILMHLINCEIQGFTVPSVLPPTLFPPSYNIK